MCSSQAQRFWYAPEGNEGVSWVKAANVMANRVTLLCWLCASLGHVFLVEQPSSARFGDMPRWRHFCDSIHYASWCIIFRGLTPFDFLFLVVVGQNIFWPQLFFVHLCLPLFQVFRQNIWMRHFGNPSWKQTCLWSNSHHISSLDMGPLTSDLKETSIPLARSYQDSYGKKRCVGNKKELRESQPLAGTIFWAQLHLNDWFLLLGKLTTHEKISIL